MGFHLECTVSNGLVDNGLDYADKSPRGHSEESILRLQAHLGELEIATGNTEAQEAVAVMNGILETNELVRNGFNAGGIFSLKEFKSVDKLNAMVDMILPLRLRLSSKGTLLGSLSTLNQVLRIGGLGAIVDPFTNRNPYIGKDGGYYYTYAGLRDANRRWSEEHFRVSPIRKTS